MRRKPAVLIALLLILLLIGGGVVVFSGKLRKPSPLPEIGKVQEFFHAIPAGAGWTVTGMNEGRRAVPTGSGWMEEFGLRRTKEFNEQTYWFAHSGTHRLAHIKIYLEDDRIVMADVFAPPPADAEDLSRVLLEKFPLLQPILKRYP